jgi:Tfp pilus assembly protein PilF
MTDFTPSHANPQQPATLWQAVALLAITLLAYLPVASAGFVWNDDDLTAILALIQQQGLSAVWFSSEAFNYWPMTWSSYWIEHQLLGNDPATGLPDPTSYHVVNVLLHAAASLLLWRVLLRLEIPGAWLAAAVFAVHPVNVESVAWITQRKNVLAMVFYLLALCQFLEFERTNRPLRLVAAVAAFLLAMLSKGAVVALPLVLLLLAWWRRGRVTRKDLLCSIPFLVVAVVMSGVEIWFQQVKAIGEETIRDAGLVERLMATGPVAWFYLQKALLPIELAFVYPLWQFDTSQAAQWLPLAAGLAVLGTLIWATRKGLDRGPLAAVLYTLFCLGPVLGLVDIYYFRYSLVADHYQYVAMPGLIVLVVAAAARFAHRHTIDRVTLRVASLGLVAVLGGLTWQQVDIYQTPQQLWRDTLARNPGCWLAHNQLANLVNSSQKVDDARQHYLEALRLIEHQFGAGHVETARVHNNLGMLLGQSARVDSDPAMMLQAITHLETACRIDPDRSEYIESLAGVLKEQGQIERAIVRLRDFVARHPDAAGTWIVLADCLVAVGRGAEADEARRRSRQADPRRQHP